VARLLLATSADTLATPIYTINGGQGGKGLAAGSSGAESIGGAGGDVTFNLSTTAAVQSLIPSLLNEFGNFYPETLGPNFPWALVCAQKGGNGASAESDAAINAAADTYTTDEVLNLITYSTKNKLRYAVTLSTS